MFAYTFALPLRQILVNTLFAALLVGAFQSFSSAATIIVNTESDNPMVGNGECDIREALDNANWDLDFSGGDCAAGSGHDIIEFHGNIATIFLTQGQLVIQESITLMGAPVGGSVDAIAIDAQSQSRIFEIATGATPDVQVDMHDLILRLGRTVSDSTFGSALCQFRGGAVCAFMPGANTNLGFYNVAFRNNSTLGNYSQGGAVWVQAEQIDIVESSFFQNYTAGDQAEGGAIHIRSGNLTMVDTNLTQNSTQQSGASGGGIYSFGSTVSIANSVFVSNETQRSTGAAIVLRNARTSWINNTVFQANFASFSGAGSSGQGAVLDISASSPTSGAPNAMVISNSYFFSNLAKALEVQYMALYLNNSTIANNNLTWFTGGAAGTVESGEIYVSSSTIAGNEFIGSEPGSGGLEIVSSEGEIANSTIVGNQANNGAGGLLLDDSDIAFRSTILAENTASSGNALLQNTSNLDAESSQFGDNMAEITGTNSNNIFIDIADVSILDDYGCATKAGSGVFLQCVPVLALMNNSPAVDKGASNGQIFDQRGAGFDRFVNGTDIGAFEYQEPKISLLNQPLSLEEGDAGTTAFTFTMIREGDLRDESWANWHVIGSGPNPATLQDFDAPSWGGGNVYFAPDQAETTFNVFVTGDTDLENDEQFTVTLGALTNGMLGASTGTTGTIVNDDALFVVPIVEIQAVAANGLESNFLYSVHQFKIIRRFDTTGFCSFELVLAGSGLHPADDADFLTAGMGTLNTYTMMPGTSEIDIELFVAADSVFEADETYALTIQNSSGCFVSNALGSAQGVIRNDDTRLSVTSVATVAPEGNATNSNLEFKIVREGDTTNSVAIGFAVSGFGSNPATSSDFVGGVLPSGIVLFQPGDQVFPVQIQVQADLVPEADETFTFEIEVPSGFEAGTTSATGTILDDDGGSGDLIFIDDFEGP